MQRKKLYKIVLAILIALLSMLLAAYILDPNLVKYSIKAKKYGPQCAYSGECNGIIALNCGAEVDGSFLYISKETGDILEYCGGYCMNPSGKYCQNCPPKEWNCK